MIHFEKVCDDNVWKIIKLTVNESQENFVATNTQSIIEAYTTITSGHVALPFGIYDDKTLVGFVMFGYGTTGDEDEPSVADGNYCLWRFMIDRNHQGRGLGRAALAAALEYLRSEPCGHAEYCWLSYEPENTVAKALYGSAGFRENGEICDGETVAVMKL